ncbi:HAD family hydrolase [Actinokineospora xionganensis]|uniref:HAD-IA family hydrolase n=1 Tax=Actinokineospora xionganensis TaxID=2684470 RepID=A0ABR7L3J4_9PSEU|nr:HAD-IA family hydrolase [Actinokineospora xionganensis]MBC6447083.1 HAD-IA family hydrolase [Actinokineospora xionganensis]
MAIRGVLLDYSGTLFRLQPGAAWVDGLVGNDGATLDQVAQDSLLMSLTAPVGPSAHLPAALRADWERRDLDPDVHRAVFVAALRGAELDLTPAMAETLYERIRAPRSWAPYPDTADALRLLNDAGIPVAVVSNIAWDVRGAFEAHGIADLVDEYVLSYAEGVVKPDPKIFLLACDRLGVEPARALMIGDSVETDGAAAALGCRFERVEPRPTQARPDALISALRTCGIAG